jgi:hypothetical protein
MKHVKDLILLKRLGFHAHPLDYALSEAEGVVLYFLEADQLTFEMKTLTNSFTPGLFQYICAACATMGKGEVTIIFPAAAHASFNQVYDESSLKRATDHARSRFQPIDEVRHEHTKIRATLTFDYSVFKV